MKRRGFGSLSPERRKAIASSGGKAAHKTGKAHEFTPEEARKAGKKGGASISRDREHMSRIGKIGGNSRKRSERFKKEQLIKDDNGTREAETTR